jgi:hypothetical protein
MATDMLDLPARGSCAGHRVHADIPFRILRDGDGGHALAIRRTGVAEPAGDVIARWDRAWEPVPRAPAPDRSTFRVLGQRRRLVPRRSGSRRSRSRVATSR